MYITEIVSDSKKKKIVTDKGSFTLYNSEVRKNMLEVESEVPDEVYEDILEGILIPRAKRRAMHLLEKMDRTEINLRNKLREGGYPPEAIDEALSYVKSFHYIDDVRYASNYIYYHQNSKSRRQIKTTLIQRGVASEIIDNVLEEEYSGDETEQIYKLLEKKHYSDEMDSKERNKIFAFLMRRGFSTENIRKCMNMYEDC